jgi:hypothetical protein
VSSSSSWCARVVAALALLVIGGSIGCTVGSPPHPTGDVGSPILPDGGFLCLDVNSRACIGSVFHSCTSDGEFLTPMQTDCEAMHEICVSSIGCALCLPDMVTCDGQNVALCSHDGQSRMVTQTCDISMGLTCEDGHCVNLCQMAMTDHAYLGCEFYAADLDNAVADRGDASAQQYAIVVSNGNQFPTDVTIERDRGPFGGASMPEVVQHVMIGPGDLEIFRLPRREIDGSSSMSACTGDASCDQGEHCWCAMGTMPSPTATDCFCRNAPLTQGHNDGTNSAATRNAYRVRSTLPVAAYQFNPLDNVGVFSNDASMLVPTSAIGTHYTVNAWPQTLALTNTTTTNGGIDLRATLTIIGTAAASTATVTLGPHVVEVVGVPGMMPGPYMAGEVLHFNLQPFEVINLETHGFNGDFTGTIIDSQNAVSVFAGSEASDAPRFDDLANRECCADHLEEQVLPDTVLGEHFYVGLTPSRSAALNRAFLTMDSVGTFMQPEYIRILAVSPGNTMVTTSLPSPNDLFMLTQGRDVILTTSQDVKIDADQSISVMQTMASQDATGIDLVYPGGDPSLISVPPVDQYRTDYVFLTPLYYGFDFITVVAPATASILFDGMPLSMWDAPDGGWACTVGPADGVMRGPHDPQPDWLTYRCQLSFPDVIGRPNVRVEDGTQHDGYHTLQATQPVSLLVSGFDLYVSYAYPGGMNIRPLH